VADSVTDVRMLSQSRMFSMKIVEIFKVWTNYVSSYKWFTFRVIVFIVADKESTSI
jgi:hypothetical protein